MAIKGKFDRLAGLYREDDSQSLTADQELRLTTLEDNYELIQIWESVTTNTGTVTIPTNAQIEENRWANGINFKLPVHAFALRVIQPCNNPLHFKHFFGQLRHHDICIVVIGNHNHVRRFFHAYIV